MRQLRVSLFTRFTRWMFHGVAVLTEARWEGWNGFAGAIAKVASCGRGMAD